MSDVGTRGYTAGMIRVRFAYWVQYFWFYAWKWSMPVLWLHRLTIRPANYARQEYLDTYRRYWPKGDING